MRSGLCRRLGAVLCAAAAVLWLIAGLWITSAASGTGSIELICRSDGAPVIGMEFKVYRVGEFTEESIELQGEFEDYSIYVPELTAAALQDAASTLENFAVIDRITPDGSAMVYESGVVNFTGLEDGVYLVSGKRLLSGNKIYTPVPILIEVKGGEAVTAFAKITARQKPTVSEQMYRVKKVWQYDDAYIQLRPVSIQVEIYRDDVLMETITLDESNDWTYDWIGDTEGVWRVKEINIAQDYKVVYRNNETQFIIINTRWVNYNTTTTTTTTTTSTTTTTTTTLSTTTTTTTTVTGTTTTTDQTTTTTSTVTGTTTSGTTTTTTTGTTTTTSTGKLPQTGQLWWPVPVCGAGGLVLFAAGWRLNKKK